MSQLSCPNGKEMNIQTLKREKMKSWLREQSVLFCITGSILSRFKANKTVKASFKKSCKEKE